MNDFKVMYKILRLLDKHKGDESFDYEVVSAQKLGVKYEEWEQLVIELQRNEYIRGVVYTQSLGEKFPHIVEPICPQITMKGMEYLETNSMMAKVKDMLKMVGDII